MRDAKKKREYLAVFSFCIRLRSIRPVDCILYDTFCLYTLGKYPLGSARHYVSKLCNMGTALLNHYSDSIKQDAEYVSSIFVPSQINHSVTKTGQFSYKYYGETFSRKIKAVNIRGAITSSLSNPSGSYTTFPLSTVAYKEGSFNYALQVGDRTSVMSISGAGFQISGEFYWNYNHYVYLIVESNRVVVEVSGNIFNFVHASSMALTQYGMGGHTNYFGVEFE